MNKLNKLEGIIKHYEEMDFNGSEILLKLIESEDLVEVINQHDFKIDIENDLVVRKKGCKI